ncbi:MAG TPA: quinone oxidoreductase [Nevskiaceae bacterium]|nr:quinone oxidoreductase [Nevskiaceae bacterium]
MYSLTARITRTGGPEVIELARQDLLAPGAGEVLLRHTAIGVNFIDTYHRSGLYAVPLPSGLGTEAAGVVEAVGSGVTNLRAGDRVAYAGGALGAYAQLRVMPANKLVRVPDAVSDEAAAALMLKGMTAYYLLHLTYAVKRGETALIHAAAGGVGSLLVPWAKALGVRVIGTAGGSAKCALARQYGCDEVIDYSSADFVTAVKRLTDGRGVDVVYDSVGKTTLPGSLDCLRRRGMAVTFGNASGKPAAVEPNTLTQKGSLYLTRPTLADYTATREELETAANVVFDALARGIIRADVRQRYPLADAARAHADLEARKTTGATILLP